MFAFQHMQCESVSLMVLFAHVWVTVVTLPPPNQEFSFSFRDMPSPERGSGAAVLPCPALAARPCPPTPGIPRPCRPWMSSCKHKLQKLSTEPKHLNFIALGMFGFVFLNRGNCWPSVTLCAAAHSLRQLKR